MGVYLKELTERLKVREKEKERRKRRGRMLARRSANWANKSAVTAAATSFLSSSSSSTMAAAAATATANSHLLGQTKRRCRFMTAAAIAALGRLEWAQTKFAMHSLLQLSSIKTVNI